MTSLKTTVKKSCLGRYIKQTKNKTTRKKDQVQLLEEPCTITMTI